MNATFIVQALHYGHRGLEYTDTKYSSDDAKEAEFMAGLLIANDGAWMPGERAVRVIERDSRQVVFGPKSYQPDSAQ